MKKFLFPLFLFQYSILNILRRSPVFCLFGVLIGHYSFSQYITSSNLPVIVLYTDSQVADTAYIPQIMDMGIIYNGEGVRNYLTDSFSYWGKIQLKLRGTSSLGFPKKSFKITTLDTSLQKTNVPLLGMPAENDWVLKGIYPDKTLLRDELSFWIYNQMGRYGSRSQFFELIVDTNYRGVYCLLEKVKRDKFRVDISSLTPNDTVSDDLTGGYIFKLDKYMEGEQGWFSNYFSNVTHDSSNYFLYEYPKPDSMPQIQKNYIKNFLDTFEDALASSYWNNPDSGYCHYINPASFVDNFIINELSRNVDGYRSSTFFYKDKDSKGDGRIHSGPVWDFDIAWNNCYYNGGNNPSGWQFQQFAQNYFVPFWWWQIMSDTTFTNKLKCRYQFLRTDILSEQKIFAHIDSMVNYLYESQQRNFARWNILGQYVEPNPSPIPATYDGEIQNMKNFISQRLVWMDANMPGNCNAVFAQENIFAENNFKTFPNPFSGNFSVAYKLPDETKLKIELVNVTGNEIAVLFYGNKTAGNYYEEISVPQLPSGIYFLKFSSENFVFHKKLMKSEGMQ